MGFGSIMLTYTVCAPGNNRERVAQFVQRQRIFTNSVV